MRTLTRVFRHNWHLKLAAIGLALPLWAALLLRVNPWTVHEFEAMVDVQRVPEGLQVISVRPPTVRIALAGRRLAIEKVRGRKLKAYAGVGQRDVGEHAVPVIVDPGELPRGVEVLSPSTYTVTIALDRTETQTRAVVTEFRGRPAPGFAATPGRPRPNEVTISGPRTAVQAVASVVAVVDVSGIQTTRSFSPRLEARDARGMPQEGITITPATAQVRVVVEPINVKTVPVRVDLVVPRGREIEDIDVTPQVVTITGSPEALRTISFVETARAVADTDGVLPVVPLKLPRGVSVVGDQPTVRIRVRYQPSAPPRPHRATAPTPPFAEPSVPRPDSFPRAPADSQDTPRPGQVPSGEEPQKGSAEANIGNG